VQALNFVTPYYLIKKDPADISIDDIERAPSQTLEWNGALPDLVDDRHLSQCLLICRTTCIAL